MNWDLIGDTGCAVFIIGLLLTLSGYSLPGNIRRWVELTFKSVGITGMTVAVAGLAAAIVLH